MLFWEVDNHSSRSNYGRRTESKHISFSQELFCRNKSILLGKILVSMTENIMHRMAAAVIENETITT